MKKNLEQSTNTQIRAALRRLFLRSRERGFAIKRDKYTCQRCGKKQSKAKGKECKVEVHHKEGVCNWDLLYQGVRAFLLCSPHFLETLCKDCHNLNTTGGKTNDR